MIKKKQLNSVSAASLIVVVFLVLIVSGGTVYFITKTGDNDATTIPDVIDDVQDESGQVATPAESKPLPEDYPSEAAPVYQPGTIEMATGMGAGGWFVVVNTNDDITTISESIARDYETLGAKVTQTPPNEDGVGQTVTSLDGYGTIMTYSVDTEKNITRISYSVNKQNR